MKIARIILFFLFYILAAQCYQNDCLVALFKCASDCQDHSCVETQCANVILDQCSCNAFHSTVFSPGDKFTRAFETLRSDCFPN